MSKKRRLTLEFLEGLDFATKEISRVIEKENLPECKYCGLSDYVTLPSKSLTVNGGLLAIRTGLAISPLHLLFCVWYDVYLPTNH